MSKINTLLLLIFADLYLNNKGKHEKITTESPWSFFSHNAYW